MSALSLGQAIPIYLEQRRQLGVALIEEGRILLSLVDFATERNHRGPLTVELALKGAQAPADANPLWWARRLDAVRRFASFWVAFDPKTQVPASGVFGPSYRRSPVHIYSAEEITGLMTAARRLPGFGALMFPTLLGLLACSGIRIGEALRLETHDIDWGAGLLTVRRSKLGQSRCLPLESSSLAALKAYHEKRQRRFSGSELTAFFLTQKGHRLSYSQASKAFQGLRNHLGWKAKPVPTLHDLRHTFAVARLIEWYRQGDDVDQKILALTTYLGHRNIRNTYWYLSAVPELVALALTRWSDPLSELQGGRDAC